MSWSEIREENKATDKQIKKAEKLLEEVYGDIVFPIYTMTKTEISTIIDKCIAKLGRDVHVQTEMNLEPIITEESRREPEDILHALRLYRNRISNLFNNAISMERLQESRPRYEPPIEIQTNARHERHFNTQMLNIEIRHAINRRRECDIAAVKVYIEDNCFSLSTLVTIKYKLTNGTRRMNQIEISNELLERCDQNRLMNMLKRFIIQTFNGGGRNAETNNT